MESQRRKKLPEHRVGDQVNIKLSEGVVNGDAEKSKEQMLSQDSGGEGKQDVLLWL